MNDIENNVEEEERGARPKRNAPIPNRYLQRIYAVENCDVVDACCRNDFQEVEGFGADEVQPGAEEVESADEEEVDQVEVAGRAFLAAHLHLQTPGETGRTIGKTRGALREMWMDMVPSFHECTPQKRDTTETVSGKGFGGGPRPVGNPKGGSVKEKGRDKPDIEGASERGQAWSSEVRGTREGRVGVNVTATGHSWVTCYHNKPSV